MAMFCDVALPVPLDRTFTYAVADPEPCVGARVLVPFSGQKLMGVVVRLHDTPLEEGVEAKPVQAVLDSSALLPEELMQLAGWIAQYYLAPLGEVLRGMLPLSAEVKRHFAYRITDAGRRVLYEGAVKGSSRRTRLTPEEQNREYTVLNFLEDGEAAKAGALRSATQAGKSLLDGMVRKRWLVREALALERDARRIEKMAVLRAEGRVPRLNANQTAILAELAGANGRMLLEELRARVRRDGIPDSSIKSLVRRGLIALEERERKLLLGGVGIDETNTTGPEDGEGTGVRARKKSSHEHELNEAQTEALAAVVASMSKGRFEPHLLYGVTGSGKTAVYIAAMQRALAAGKSALMLVPEIGLTSAMAGQMFAAFGEKVALLHSGLTPDERAQQWHRIRRGDARVVVGTRSAVFAPARDLGLIVVDEEHDSSYKQEETPRYHGRDVAVMRGKINNAVVVLGSATPSLESWANAERGRYRRIEMTARVADRSLPAVELVDMRAEFEAVRREEIFSRRLVEEAQATLDRGEQAIILLNRRGYSFVAMCRSCGEKIECENCAISMTLHKPREGFEENGEARVGQRLECHYCGFRRTVPVACPKCGSEHLYYLGAGSQRGEERLREIFPEARIGRLDRDTARRRGDIERVLCQLHSGEINLLVGTQMIAKGHDVHGVTFVGVVGADFQLGLPDFRAAERVFQLLTQVSGRAGRGDLRGSVLVQTYHPDHYAIQFAQQHDYPGFVAKEIQYRRWMHYPPYTALANVVVQSDRMEEAAEWAARLGRCFERERAPGLRVLGPAAAPIVRLKRIYRFHFVIKADLRAVLGSVLRRMLACAEVERIPQKNILVDVDAVHLM